MRARYKREQIPASSFRIGYQPAAYMRIYRRIDGLLFDGLTTYYVITLHTMRINRIGVSDIGYRIIIKMVYLDNAH